MLSNLKLASRYEGLVRDLVESGRYGSAREVLEDGLRLVEEREASRAGRLEALRRQIADGVSSGPPALLDMQAVKSEARRRHAAGASRRDD